MKCFDGDIQEGKESIIKSKKTVGQLDEQAYLQFIFLSSIKGQ